MRHAKLTRDACLVTHDGVAGIIPFVEALTVESIIKEGLAQELTLRYYPDPILRRKAVAVRAVTPELRDLAQRMLEVMYREDGVGLAAPQVGLSIRMLVLNITGEPSGERIVLNPRIVKAEGRVDSDEGCLSFPGMRIIVARDAAVTLDYMDLEGKTQLIEASALLSRVIQHEIDHLDGVLFIDRLSPAGRSGVKTRLKEMERRFSPKS